MPPAAAAARERKLFLTGSIISGIILSLFPIPIRIESIFQLRLVPGSENMKPRNRRFFLLHSRLL